MKQENDFSAKVKTNVYKLMKLQYKNKSLLHLGFGTLWLPHSVRRPLGGLHH